MTPIFGLRIALSLGARRRELNPRELGDALGVADPSPALAKLLFTGHPQAMNKGKGALGEEASRQPVTLNESFNSVPVRTVRTGGECRGEVRGGAVDNPEALATFLAERLRDWRSLGFYRKIARQLPESVVRDALARALDVPAHAIRRSRAAYFTTLIVKSLATIKQSSRSNSSTLPYDLPIPPAS